MINSFLECIIKADIVLLIDGSGSVSTYGIRETGDNDYYKNFVFKMIKQIISLADVSEENVHIGVLFFGSKNIENVINQVSITTYIRIRNSLH